MPVSIRLAAGRRAKVDIMQIRSVHTPLIAVLALMLCGAFSLVLADQVVYFSNGKAMMVKSVEQRDEVTILELEGGGSLGVPTEQIVRIEDYAVSKPNAARPPAPPSRAAAPTVTPPRTTASGGVAGAATPPGAAADQPANLVAEAPSVVPDASENLPAALASPRDGSIGPGSAPGVGVAAVPSGAREADQVGASTASAAAIAAQQSQAARVDQRERAGRLNTPRGRTGRGGMARGQALMGGQSPRRPGQGAPRDAANAPAGSSQSQPQEEVVPTAAERRGGKRGAASGKSAPPRRDGESEQSPTKAN